MADPVLLPAGLAVVGAERLFLPFADHRDAVGRNTKVDQVVLYHVRAPAAEREVVLGAPSRVAMALDRNRNAPPPPHIVGIALQRRLRIVSNRRFVEIEE